MVVRLKFNAVATKGASWLFCGARACALSALLLSASSAAFAQSPSENQSPRIQLSVPLKLNGKYLGDVGVEIDNLGNGDVVVDRLLALLEPVVGRQAFEALTIASKGREHAPFSDFSNDNVTVVFDPGLLEVNVGLAVNSLSENEIALSSRPSPQPSQFDQPENFSLGLGATLTQGYVFNDDNNEGFAPILANFEGYANLGGFNGPTIFYGFDLVEGRESLFQRGEIQVVKDFYDEAIRVAVGDINASLTAFQAAPPLLGVSVGRQYRTIQPFQNILSSGRGSLVLERDSEVEVYVNGALAETLTLPAGRFELKDFPFSIGSNDVRLVVEDDRGRTELAEFSFFSQGSLLGEGLVDFGFAAGVPRRPVEGGFGYDDEVVVTGFANYGLTSRLNVGVNGQARSNRQQLGASFGIGLPFGLVSADVTGSRANDDDLGAAFGVDYQNNFAVGSTTLNANSSIIYRTENFSAATEGLLQNARLVGQGLLRAQFENGLSLGFSGGFTDEYGAADRYLSLIHI